MSQLNDYNSKRTYSPQEWRVDIFMPFLWSVFQTRTQIYTAIGRAQFICRIPIPFHYTIQFKNSKLSWSSWTEHAMLHSSVQIIQNKPSWTYQAVFLSTPINKHLHSNMRQYKECYIAVTSEFNDTTASFKHTLTLFLFQLKAKQIQHKCWAFKFHKTTWFCEETFKSQ